MMITIGMDLLCFMLVFLSAKHHKSIPRVTIFLIIVMPWWIPCLPWQKKQYNIQQIKLLAQTPAIVAQRKLPFVITAYISHYSVHTSLQHTYRHFGTSTSKRFSAGSSFDLYYIAVMDSSILFIWMSNTIKHKLKLSNPPNLSHAGNFCPTLVSTCLLSVIGTINSVLNGWSWETLASLIGNSPHY